MRGPLLFLALTFLQLGLAFAEQRIEGQVLERGTKIPLKEVNVFLLPHKLKAMTDQQGYFVFEAVPEGDFQWIVSQTGYEKLEREDSTTYIGARTLYVEKSSYLGFETTIVGQKQKRDDSRKTLKQEEFLTLPGAGGDPVKAVQNLPGVNRVGGFSSSVVIQGSAPKDTAYDLDGHDIPIVFHFGGLTSVVMPEAIESVDYLSAGYGANYSSALGGIISLKTRDPDVKDRDRKGFFFIDTLKSGALIEGKIDDHSSYLISGRYSYVGLFLKQAMKGNDSLNLTVAPEYSDLTFIYKNKLTEVDDLKVDLLASRDSLGFVLKEPVKDDPSIRGTFRNETDFLRIIPQWTHKIDSERTAKLSAGIGQDVLLVDAGDIYFNIDSKELSVRGEWEQRLSPDWMSQVGFDNNYAWSNVKLKVPVRQDAGGVGSPVSGSVLKEANVYAVYRDIGTYWRNEWTVTPTLTLIPALRLDRFSETSETLGAPRFAARYRWSESLLLKTATGLYYQPPQPQEVSPDYGNPDVKSPSAIHFMLGFEKDFRGGRSDGWQWSSSYFRRDFSKLVISSSDYIVRNGSLAPEVYNNTGGGRAQGIETMVKFDLAPWSGWVSYTLSESKRWDPKHSEYNFQYDQTHNLNLVGAYDYGRNWKLSGRYRYVTGNPYTPVLGGTFDADNDVYVPTRGGFYSERQSAFQQLDFRVDKKWILDTEVWSIYLDIQNLLNAKNAEQIRYSYDYSQQQNVSGLPILPSIGVKGEF
jgi:hypothetical protein